MALRVGMGRRLRPRSQEEMERVSGILVVVVAGWLEQSNVWWVVLERGT